MRRHVGFAIAATALALLTSSPGCSSESSGGDSAGQIGDACSPTFHNQGCLKKEGEPDVRMSCNAQTKTWEQLETCAADATCVETLDPTSVPGGVSIRMVTTCETSAAADADAIDAAQDTAFIAGTPFSEMRIDEQNVAEHHFPWSDPAGGQVVATVRVRNAGDGSAILNGLVWSSDNPAMAMSWQDGAGPTWPHTMHPNDTLHLLVKYTPKLNKGAHLSGALSLSWAVGVGGVSSVQFHAPDLVGKACASGPTHEFVLTPNTDHLERCFQVRNCATAPLKLISATLQQSASDFALVGGAKAGDTLPPLGGPQNPKEDPQGWSFCVLPKGKPEQGNSTAQLQVKTDGAPNLITLSMKASWREPPDFHLSCDSPAKGLAINWQQANEVTCTMTFQGSGGLQIKQAQIQAWHGNQQAEVTTLYKLSTSFKSDEAAAEEAKATPLFLAKKGQLLMQVSRQKDEPKGQAGAHLRIVYDRGDGDRSAWIPIHSATCDVPHLQQAPTGDALYLHTPMGGNAVTSIVFNVPTCAPTTIMMMCTSQFGGSNATAMCAGGKQSTVVILDTPVFSGTLAAQSLSAFQVRLPTPAEPLALKQHWVTPLWCQGTGTSSVCHGKAIKELFPVWYHAGPAPTLVPPLVATPKDAKAGDALALRASAHGAAWPMPPKLGWSWSLVARPAGSTAWIQDEQQRSSSPALDFVPDLPGSYQIRVAYRIQSPNNAQVFHWSPATSITMNVIE